MELIYNQNDNRLQSRRREKEREGETEWRETLEDSTGGEDREVSLRLERDCGLLGGCGSPQHLGEVH